MNVKEALVKPKSLIADKSNWIQFESEKKNSEGKICYCALGAIRATARKLKIHHIGWEFEGNNIYFVVSVSNDKGEKSNQYFNDMEHALKEYPFGIHLE